MRWGPQNLELGSNFDKYIRGFLDSPGRPKVNVPWSVENDVCPEELPKRWTNNKINIFLSSIFFLQSMSPCFIVGFVQILKLLLLLLFLLPFPWATGVISTGTAVFRISRPARWNVSGLGCFYFYSGLKCAYSTLAVSMCIRESPFLRFVWNYIQSIASDKEGWK